MYTCSKLSNQRQRLDRTGRPTLGNRWARLHTYIQLGTYKASGHAHSRGEWHRRGPLKRKPGNSLALSTQPQRPLPPDRLHFFFRSD